MMLINNCTAQPNPDGSVTLTATGDAEVRIGEVEIVLPDGWTITVSEIHGGGTPLPKEIEQ